jgi:hypothetical protein
LFCPVSEVLPSRAKNNTQLGNTFFITSMYLDNPQRHTRWDKMFERKMS